MPTQAVIDALNLEDTWFGSQLDAGTPAAEIMDILRDRIAARGTPDSNLPQGRMPVTEETKAALQAAYSEMEAHIHEGHCASHTVDWLREKRDALYVEPESAPDRFEHSPTDVWPPMEVAESLPDTDVFEEEAMKEEATEEITKRRSKKGKK